MLSCSPSFMVLIHVRDSAFPVFHPKAVTLTKHVCMEDFPGVRKRHWGDPHPKGTKQHSVILLMFPEFLQSCWQRELPTPGQEVRIPILLFTCHPFPLCFFSSYCVPAFRDTLPSLSASLGLDVGTGLGFRSGELCLGRHPFRSMDEATCFQSEEAGPSSQATACVDMARDVPLGWAECSSCPRSRVTQDGRQL